MSGVRLLTQTEPEVHGDSRTLVVVLHGLAKDLNDWCEAIREFLPNADLLVPRYSAHLLSNIDPRRVADQLAQYSMFMKPTSTGKGVLPAARTSVSS